MKNLTKRNKKLEFNIGDIVFLDLNKIKYLYETFLNKEDSEVYDRVEYLLAIISNSETLLEAEEKFFGIIVDICHKQEQYYIEWGTVGKRVGIKNKINKKFLKNAKKNK